MKLLLRVLHIFLTNKHLRPGAFFVAFSCVASFVLPTAAQAQALVSCTVVEKAAFNPPLTNQPQNVTVTMTSVAACPISVAGTTPAGIDTPPQAYAATGMSCQSLNALPPMLLPFLPGVGPIIA